MLSTVCHPSCPSASCACCTKAHWSDRCWRVTPASRDTITASIVTSSVGVPDIAIGGASEFCVMITAAAPVTDQVNRVGVRYASHCNFLSVYATATFCLCVPLQLSVCNPLRCIELYNWLVFTCFLSIQNFLSEVAGASFDHHEFASVAIPSQLSAAITWRGEYDSSVQLRVNLKAPISG